MTSKVYTLPAPIGGLNTRDSADNMPETDCIAISNMVCYPEAVERRYGYVNTQSGATIPTDEVETVFEAVHTDGNRVGIACADGEIWYLYGGVSWFSLLSGLTNNEWQWVNFRNRYILVNGSDQPQQIIPSPTTPSNSNATYTGIADDADLINVDSYKNRLYFVEKESTSYWYGDVDAITGALTEVDIGAFLKKGGDLLWVGSKTRDTGAGFEDLFVIASSEGDLLLYSGSSPEDAAWSMVGRYEIPQPAGLRSFYNLDGDLLIITREGILSLDKLMRHGSVDESVFVSEKIQNIFPGLAWDTNPNKFELIRDPKQNVLIFSYVGSTNSTQYAMHLITNGWSKWTISDARTWGIYDGDVIFGDADGDIQKFTKHFDDDGTDIAVGLTYAYNYFGNRASTKIFQMVRPILELGNAADQPTISMNTDFRYNSFQETTMSPSILETDNTSRDFYSVNGMGKAAAIGVSIDDVSTLFTLSSMSVVFSEGGIL